MTNDNVINLLDSEDNDDHKNEDNWYSTAGGTRRIPIVVRQLSSGNPIDTEVSSDVIDVELEDTEEPTSTKLPPYHEFQTHQEQQPPGAVNMRTMTIQSHPRRLKEVSKQRRKRMKIMEHQEKELERLRAAQERAKEAEKGGHPNFIIIDDDPLDEDIKPNTKYNDDRFDQDDIVASKEQQQQQQQAGNDTDANTTTKPYSFSLDRDFSYLYSNEAAEEMQERLLREASLRVRTMRAFVLPPLGDIPPPPPPPSITEPMRDVAERYPHHWKWRDPYACLGLPKQSELRLVKSHFRKLARLYHPDASKDPNTSNKFHGITIAYHKICGID